MAEAGAVTLIQRFGSALNLNVHFHMLFLDGVYIERPDGSLRFRWVKAPTSAKPEVGKDPAQPEGRVVRELRKGFLLGDTLLRPAEVAVNRPAGDSAER